MNVIEKKVLGKKLDFKDVLIVPKKTFTTSRKQVHLQKQFHFPFSKTSWKGVPLAVSNMDTTGTIHMAKKLQEHNILTCLHKYHEPEDFPDDLCPEFFAVSTGIKRHDLYKLDKIVQMKPYIKFICIDVANGYMENFVDVCTLLRKRYPSKVLIAGNVVTPEQVQYILLKAKVDIIKLGIGSGSVCTTRIKTGVGYPQFSAILECHEICRHYGGLLMSDGGIQEPGDLGKAFGAGADFVMCGGLFAGHHESGGETIIENGNMYKVFYGMSSKEAMETHSGPMKTYRSAEGKAVKIPYRGFVDTTLHDYLGGLRSTMTYVDAKTIDDLYNNTKFIEVNNRVNTAYNNYVL